MRSVLRIWAIKASIKNVRALYRTCQSVVGTNEDHWPIRNNHWSKTGLCTVTITIHLIIYMGKITPAANVELEIVQKETQSIEKPN